MSRLLFGTDGIRGRANTSPMTAGLAMRVASAAGLHFLGDHGRRPMAVIGKDTRLSGYMLENAMVAGFTSIGIDVVLVGPMPTPAVAILTRSLRADLGVMISASHNPFQDNGIKLFGPDGFKLSDAVEAEIEARMDTIGEQDLAGPRDLGRARRLDDVRGRYVEVVKGTFPRGLRLDGLKIVVDCANGAAYRVAPEVLYELGAEVIPIAVDPDGFNINDRCGATMPAAMSAKVVETGADLGIALDGDADRLIMADSTGRVIDGDQIMALITTSWAEAGKLKGGACVSTVMSNLGLERYLEGRGVRLIRTGVGDRYVLERMRADGINVGGEQSGHMVLTDYCTTGDGLIAALQVLAVMIKADAGLSEVTGVFEPLPQLLKNVRYTGASPLETPDVRAAVAHAEAQLKGRGRLLIRKSGTEPLIRVMAEGEDPAEVERIVDQICDVVRATGSEAAE